MERIGVVGGGQMGGGIAEVGARAGLSVVVVETDEELATRTRANIEKSIGRAVERGKATQEDMDRALAAVTTTTDMAALADRQIVIEAIVENEEAKAEVFGALDSIVEDKSAILASNTSSIPIMKLGAVTSRPEQVVGMHFFNPAPVMSLVEIVKSLLTSDETVERVRAFGTDVLGKKMILAKDRAGFIVNALLVPYMLNAIRMLEEGFASAEDIDTGMVEGTNHPMGPLALTDFVGLDTTLFVGEQLYQEFGDPFYSPPPMLRRMVEGGLLGRKTGRGFYTY